MLQARHVLIAAGAELVKLGIFGEGHLVTNEEFLQLEAMPCRIVLVGGGYIAAEFSNLAARAGTKVTILQHGKRLLKQFEPEKLLAAAVPAGLQHFEWISGFGRVGSFVPGELCSTPGTAGRMAVGRFRNRR